jgi:rhamnose utilization protein RhaD (predicted bifunctional aldolase and dehydrogenase)
MMLSKNKLSSEIKYFCQKLGKNKLLVQGGGGNVSWKTNSKLWIKASGTSLEQAKKKNVFIPVNLKELNKSINEGDFFKKPLVKIGKLLPSIETYMHAVIPHKIVVHLHSIDFLAILIKKNSQTLFNQKLPEYNFSFFNYIKPGGELAKNIYKKNIKFNRVNLILLQNHGIIVSSDNLKLIVSFLSKIHKKIKFKFLPKQKKIKFNKENITGFRFCKSKKIQNIVLNTKIFNNLKKNWAIAPDHVNYLGESPVIWKSFKNFKLPKKKFIPYLFFKNFGVYENLSNTKNHKDQLTAYYDTMIRQDNFNLIKTLNKKQINEIMFWDIEIYRRSL